MYRKCSGPFAFFLALQLCVHAQSWQPAAPNNIYFTGGNVGIGTGTPVTPLHITSSTGYAAILLGNSDVNGFVLTRETTDNSFNIWSGPFGTGSVNRLKITSSGNLSIGGGTPVAQFNITSPGNYVSMLLGNNDATGFVITKEASDNSFNIWSGPFGSGSLNRFKITNGGNVLIGKMSQTNSSYLLDVNGTIRGNKMVVNSTGADYVFEPGYPLPSLPDLKKFIQHNHHLPDVAPARQMKEEGLDVGGNQTILLQKIEELTLYILQQQKDIDDLKAQVRQLQQN
jgi:hypothetical protein